MSPFFVSRIRETPKLMVGVDKFHHGLTTQHGNMNVGDRKSVSFFCISDPRDTFLGHSLMENF